MGGGEVLEPGIPDLSPSQIVYKQLRSNGAHADCNLIFRHENGTHLSIHLHPLATKRGAKV